MYGSEIIKEIDAVFNDIQKYEEIFLDKIEILLKQRFPFLKPIIRNQGSLYFNKDKEYRIYISHSVLYLEIDGDTFPFRNFESLYIHLAIFEF